MLSLRKTLATISAFIGLFLLFSVLPAVADPPADVIYDTTNATVSGSGTSSAHDSNFTFTGLDSLSSNIIR